MGVQVDLPAVTAALYHGRDLGSYGTGSTVCRIVRPSLSVRYSTKEKLVLALENPRYLSVPLAIPGAPTEDMMV